MLVLLLLAFAGGRFSAPKPDVKVHETEKIVYQDRIVTQVQRVEVAAATKTETRVVYRTRIVRADGTREEHEEIRSGAATQTSNSSSEQLAQTATHVQTTDMQRTVEIHSAGPSWRMGVISGVEPLHLLQPQLLGPVAFGAVLEHRLVGPVWAGAWAISSGSGGLTLSLDL